MMFYKTGAIERKSADIPVITVKRGEVSFTVRAQGDLQGGTSELLTAVMMGNAELMLTSLRSPGELVKEQDVVARFDTTEQEFKLKEAEADLAEAEQQVIMAQADSQAKAEEAQYELAQAKADLRQAELETRRNPLLATIAARQNTLALEAAPDKLRHLGHDIPNRLAKATPSPAILETSRNKATVEAATARPHIQS